MGTTQSFKLELLLSVRILDEGYAASILVTTLDTTTPFVSNDIADYLRRHSVVFGFDVPRFDEVVKTIRTGPVNTSIPVARGKRMTPGKDGSENYKFRTSLLAGSQTDSKIDFRERGLVNNVRAGQIIAVIEKEIPGKPGLLVNGQKIEPPPVKCFNICEAGSNVERYVDGTMHTYVSMSAGHARRHLNEIQVIKDFMIEGDLDYTKGNIDFVGNVGISGDVKSGFFVIAAGDICIGGNVESGATVIAGRNISVRGSVTCGMENGKFEAKGDITVKSISASKISAGGNLFVKDYIGDSEVYCEGVFASSWGTILGSTIEAINGIAVNKIGKEGSLSQNLLYSGKSLLSEERLKKNASELQNLINDLALLAKKVSIERDTDTANADQTSKDRGKQIAVARNNHVKQTKERIEILEKEQLVLQARFRINPEAVMNVKGVIYPTTTLRNGANMLKVLDAPVSKVKLDYKEEPATGSAV